MRDVTLQILCEGQTEKNFVTQVLAPHLRSLRVFARANPLVPHGFGTVTFDTFRNAIKAELGIVRGHVFVTTMIDLYGLPAKYPGDPGPSGIRGVRRAELIEAGMAEMFNNPQLIPYIQVHEFEALVFVDLDELPAAFPDGEAKVAPDQLRRSIGDTRPEDINDGSETAPSKRLARATQRAYEAKKPIAGPQIAARIGLPRLRAACPHFGQWLARLESLSSLSPASATT